MTLKDKIVTSLRARGPMDDASLARILNVRHQAVNQAARQLAETGRVTRVERGGTLKNILTNDREQPMATEVLSSTTTRSPLVGTEMARVSCIALVGCVKQKLDHAAPAGELYTSPLFHRQREWAVARCDRWLILSAKYGLLKPETTIDPYEMTLKAASTAQRRAWSKHVLEQLRQEVGSFDGHHFEIYSGRDYFGYGLIDGLLQGGATVAVPWQGLGLGQRLALRKYSPGG
jgi:hypothetical protein